MPFEGQTYKRPRSWVQDRQQGEEVDANLHDGHDDDLAAAMSQLLRRDGQGAASGEISMGNNNITNLKAGTAVGHAVSLVDDGGVVKLQPMDGSLLTNVIAAASAGEAVVLQKTDEPTHQLRRASADDTDVVYNIGGVGDVFEISGDTGETIWRIGVQFEGVVKLTDGTASAPALTFDSETTTGLYKSGFTVDGQIAWAVDGSNNILIGYESGNSSAALSITPVTSQASLINVQGAVAGGTPTISASGADAAIDLKLAPKSTGVVQIGTAAQAVATATDAWQATHTIKVKDDAGTEYYIGVSTSTDNDFNNSNTDVSLTGNATFDPGTISANSSVTQVITVTGATTSQIVGLRGDLVNNASLVVTGYVSAADTVTAVIRNVTGSGVSPGSTTLYAIVSDSFTGGEGQKGEDGDNLVVEERTSGGFTLAASDFGKCLIFAPTVDMDIVLPKDIGVAGQAKLTQIINDGTANITMSGFGTSTSLQALTREDETLAGRYSYSDNGSTAVATSTGVATSFSDSGNADQALIVIVHYAGDDFVGDRTISATYNGTAMTLQAGPTSDQSEIRPGVAVFSLANPTVDGGSKTIAVDFDAGSIGDKVKSYVVHAMLLSGVDQANPVAAVGGSVIGIGDTVADETEVDMSVTGGDTENIVYAASAFQGDDGLDAGYSAGDTEVFASTSDENASGNNLYDINCLVSENTSPSADSNAVTHLYSEGDGYSGVAFSVKSAKNSAGSPTDGVDQIGTNSTTIGAGLSGTIQYLGDTNKVKVTTESVA